MLQQDSNVSKTEVNNAAQQQYAGGQA